MRTPSHHIFTTEITHRDDRKTWEISSQPLSDASIRLNAKNNRLLLLTLMALSDTSADNFYLHLSVINRLIYYCRMAPDVWGNILDFLPGFTRNAGDYALSIMSIRQSSLFKSKKIAANPSVVVNAAMRGQEEVVLNTLQDDPSALLKKAIVKNSVGVECEVTSLQAAIMANDIQLVEKMQAHFARLTTDLSGNPIDGLGEMQSQIKAIYVESLQRYCDIQKNILRELEKKKHALLESGSLDKTYDEIQEKIKQATKRMIDYKAALEKNDINEIIAAHNQAQEHNAFDFDSYVNAICAIDENVPIQKAALDAVMELIHATTPEETAAVVARTGVAEKQSDAARLKSFDELTLVEKLNRFREELVKHMQQEIIFNPNHILAGLKHNEETWNADDAGRIADPGYKKRPIIFSQLAGWAQRNAAEPVKQDIRRGCQYDYFTEDEEPRTRRSRFNKYSRNGNIVRNSLADVSLVDSSVVDGLGYKVAADGRGAGAPWPGAGWGNAGWVWEWQRHTFSELMSSKNSKLGKLMQSTSAARTERRCVIQ